MNIYWEMPPADWPIVDFMIIGTLAVAATIVILISICGWFKALKGRK